MLPFAYLLRRIDIAIQADVREGWSKVEFEVATLQRFSRIVTRGIENCAYPKIKI